MRRCLLIAVVTAVLAVTFAGAALSQTPATGSPISGGGPTILIASIELEGLSTVDSARVMRTLRILPGDRLSSAEVRAALLRLWRLQVFNDINVYAEESPEGLKLKVRMIEQPRISAVEFEGNDEVDSEDLLRRTGLAVGQRLSNLRLAAAKDSLIRIYKEKGFIQAKVDPSTRPAGLNDVAVLFTITEGEEARITGFEFIGAEHFDNDDLKGQLASKAKGFLKSGKVDAEKLAQDVTKLLAFYRNRGFKDVTVKPDSMRFSPDGKEITLVFQIHEGERYRVTDVKWEGQQAIDTRALSLLPQPRIGSWYDQSEIQKTVEAAYSHYAELGFLYVSVTPRERVVAPGELEIVFQFQEGAPSRIREIRITGNTYTKEKVIRREFAIREGDRFSRTLLMRTQQNIFRLGFFENVEPDFRPADSSDVDLYFKVTEKRSGTASAGAGYSSEGGLTGFLQLGHNNLFGNAWAVSVQLERGARRNAISLSFTDPWFLDTRTTFGASIFTRERLTDVFGSTGTSGTSLLQIRETRRGGSLRLGRPIWFMSFTRGFLTYRLENVRQIVDQETAGPPSNAAKELQSQVIPSQTTSSITLSILRDSRNHPFYPSGGSRIDYSSEFAGKLLGGDIRFNKHQFDGRFYFPSVLRSVSTMIRWRGGIVAGYGDGSLVPDFERFRLGGTTFYGLRGYQDFEIVPIENVSFVVDTTITGEPIVTEIRYPGGRWMTTLTFEQQFPIANPLRGLLFVEGGNTWNSFESIQPFNLFKSAGFGFRLEIPLLGNLGLDFGYGFDRVRPGWRTHFLLGNMLF